MYCEEEVREIKNMMALDIYRVTESVTDRPMRVESRGLYLCLTLGS